MAAEEIELYIGEKGMEYLRSINDKLAIIPENKINYINVFDTESVIYGCPFWNILRNFRKFTLDVDKENSGFADGAKHDYAGMSQSSSGCFLRFKTKSKRIILKAELRREWDFSKMTLYCSSGFDVYDVIEGCYSHRTVFAPESGKKIFAEQISNDPNSEICIYLPLYNEIKNLYIGTEAPIEKSNSIDRVPILFFGNSITQGAAASRSGNCFPNIVSRLMNNEIYNLSVSSNCKGQVTVADQIGRMNLRAIVIDYSRNAYDLNEFKKNYMPFYQRLRVWHKETPIILMTTAEFKNQIGYIGFDSVIEETFEKAKQLKHNTYLLHQKSLFEEREYDLVTVDGIHYTDVGMFRIAEALTGILSSVS